MRYLALATAVFLCSFIFALAQGGAQNASSPAVPDPTGAPQVKPPALRRRSPLAKPSGGRTTPANAPGGVLGNAKTPEVPPTTAVITIQGVCSNPQTKASCKKVITREDLDRFIAGLSPNATAQARGRLAVQYARMLVYSALAKQEALDKDPDFAKEVAAELELLRTRILASAFLKNVQSKTPAVTPTEVEKFYDVHRDEYDLAQVRRLSVPLEVPNQLKRPLTRAAVKPYMEELRKRAVAGEDFNVLQQDAYQYFHVEAPPPPVDIKSMDRKTTQGDETKVWDLEPGEVSEVLDSFAAEVIIKVESKNATPLQSVRQEIESNLRATLVQSRLNKLTKDVRTQFNLQYFEMPTQPDIFGSAVSSGNDTSGIIRPRSPVR